MPPGKNNRGKLLHLERFLREYTDQDHPALMEDILAYLETHEISAERKGIYDDINYLRSINEDIQAVRVGRAMGYYLGKREFELSELKLLVDAVQSSKFITEEKSFSMISRLEKLGSVQQATQLRRQVWVRGRIKTMNESVFHTVDQINEAMESNCQILFQYYTWDRAKNRVLRRNGDRYAVSPWALLLDNENYYLLAWENGMMKHFRVDKMLNIRVTDWPREGKEAFARLNMAAYTDAHFGMFSGDSIPVRLLFHKDFAGIAIDQFGTDIIMVPEGDDHFIVTVNVAVNVQFFGWLFGLGDKVRILSPQSAVDDMREHILSVLSQYPAKPLSSLLSVYDTILFVDTETTGFNAETDHLTEFAAITVTKEGTETYTTLVQLPDGVTIPDEIVAMTGITTELCAAGITSDELRDKIKSLINGRTLFVAYNAQFDASFLLALTGFLSVDYLDAMTVYRDRAAAPHKLSDAIKHYGVQGKNSHRAMDDAMALMEVTKALEKEKNNLLYYVNRFGYKAKYGIRGKQIERVAYYAQLE